VLSIISLLVVVVLSILVTRIATIALVHTGLSRETAKFQARSAFTGAGFTTEESERVVRHPVRRRIVLALMLVGNAGIVTAVASLILTFVHQGDDTSLWLKLALLIAGLVVLWALAASSWIDRRLSWLIDRALKRYTSLDIRDYASLMHLVGEYRLVELHVRENDWLAERKLAESDLHEEGVIVLGIKRVNGNYIGAPKGQTEIRPRDTLILYGRISVLEGLDHRTRDWRGDLEHRTASIEQARVEQEERSKDDGSLTDEPKASS
jgi:hypothetical protein